MKAEEILEHLSLAFGGVSQIPLVVIGQALRGRMQNAGLAESEAHKICLEISRLLCERFENLQLDEVESEICKGAGFEACACGRIAITRVRECEYVNESGTALCEGCAEEVLAKGQHYECNLDS